MPSPRWSGKTLGGRYKIEDLLGRGGMSAVYKAIDPNLSRTVAIKLIHPHLADVSEFVDRFREEATVVAQLRHPNIVQVFDFNRDEDGFYMVMEFVAGETLRERLERLNKAGGEMSLVEVMKYAINICDAADYAHRRDLIHRDIKPANVMLDLQEQAILMDFGIAKIIGGPQFTATGATVGTAMYMSPEQIRGERVDERSDIYSIGVVLFEMLSGQPPFQSDSPTALLMMHLSDPVPDLQRLRPDCPAEVKSIVEKAMAKDRGQRYQHASEMSAALRKALVTLQASLQAPTAVVPEPGGEPTKPPRARPPAASPSPMPEVPPSPPPSPGYSPPEVVSGGKPRRNLMLAGCLLPVSIVAVIGVVFLVLFVINKSEDGNGSPLVEAEATPATPEIPQEEAPPTEAATETPTAVKESTEAITGLEELSQAVIQIEAQGSFVDPAVGTDTQFVGSGSGFIIDPSGIAVTNNHVVTGAALFRVWVGGDPEPINARVLGVSECSDLAVIDLDGDGYRYLEWYDGPISAGLEVYAAGYPLGEPEFTLTKGIIAKERALGESEWSSVDAVVQHDAAINPGSSGGPLVTSDGKVVAINYRGSAALNYFMAISRDEALTILNKLRQGEDIASIGINGVAVNDGDAISGIWVYSVKSGSPADQAGIEGGDILTKIEGVTIATNGNMSDYCDILRSHGPEDTLTVKVLRFSTQEVLEGQINGEPLVPASSFTDRVAGQIGDGIEEESTSDNNYWTVNDDTFRLFMQVPAEWSDVSGESVSIDLDDRTYVSAAIQASPNIDDAWNSYSTPGVFLFVSEELAADYDAASLLDAAPFGEEWGRDCHYDGRYEIERELYSGLYDQYSDCGDVGGVIFALVAAPENGNFLAYLLIQVVTEADLEAAGQIWNTFYIAE